MCSYYNYGEILEKIKKHITSISDERISKQFKYKKSEILNAIEIIQNIEKSLNDRELLEHDYDKQIFKQHETINDSYGEKLSLSHINIEDIPNDSFYEKIKSEIILTDEPISISRFSHIINDFLLTDNYKKIHATIITDWLLEKGYFIEKSNIMGKKVKIPTKKGIDLGINRQVRNRDNSSYEVNLYSKEAQIFVIKNLKNLFRG